eukprot:4610384-Pleurochrysis_carterae.AAC.1
MPHARGMDDATLLFASAYRHFSAAVPASYVWSSKYLCRRSSTFLSILTPRARLQGGAQSREGRGLSPHALKSASVHARRGGDGVGANAPPLAVRLDSYDDEMHSQQKQKTQHGAHCAL